MKHVSFKTVAIANPEGAKGILDYRLYLRTAIQQPLDGKAVGIEEMHGSLRLLTALDKGDEKGVDFEDSDFELLCTKVRAMRFRWVDPAFAKFIEDVTAPK